MGLIPGLVRSPGGGICNTLQYSCLGSLGKRNLAGTGHEVTKSQIWLKRLSMQPFKSSGPITLSDTSQLVNYLLCTKGKKAQTIRLIFPSVMKTGLGFICPFVLTCFYKKFLLEYSWLTMLCSFLMYSRVNQLYIHIYPLFFRFFSCIGHYRVLSTVACAMQ